MPNDVLNLGGIVFDDFSTPETMMGGGQQAMVVHKLPGGSRSIDTLGPDEADIAWRGQFFSSNAFSTALALDAMRAAGQVVPLSWGGQFRSVIINTFIYRVHRLPFHVFYEIICTIAQNPLLGNLSQSPSSIDVLVTSDLNTGAVAGGLAP